MKDTHPGRLPHRPVQLLHHSRGARWRRRTSREIRAARPSRSFPPVTGLVDKEEPRRPYTRETQSKVGRIHARFHSISMNTDRSTSGSPD